MMYSGEMLAVRGALIAGSLGERSVPQLHSARNWTCWAGWGAYSHPPLQTRRPAH